jgi:hypothetical protein
MTDAIVLDHRAAGFFRDERLVGHTMIGAARYLKNRGVALDTPVTVFRDSLLVRATSVAFALREALQIPLAEAA